jgi:hypothetical protein
MGQSGSPLSGGGFARHGNPGEFATTAAPRNAIIRQRSQKQAAPKMPAEIIHPIFQPAPASILIKPNDKSPVLGRE